MKQKKIFIPLTSKNFFKLFDINNQTMKFIILGSGSSVGVPWITGNWGNCNKK